MSLELSVFNKLSFDDYNYHIIPKLWAVDVCAFSRVSKATRAIVRTVASQTHEDRNILGGRLLVNFKGSIPKYLFHKQKMDVLEEIFTRHPEFEEELRGATVLGAIEAKKVAEEKANKNTSTFISWSELTPDEQVKLPALCLVAPFLAPIVFHRGLRDYIHESIDPSPYHTSGLDFIFKNASLKVKPLIVLFDLDTMQLHKNCLYTAIFLSSQLHSPELLRSILTHQMAADLPGNGLPPTALTKYALNTYKNSDEDKLKYIKVIFSHHNAKDICCEELQSVLTYAVRGGLCDNGKWCGGNLKIVKAILSHPNAIQIPISGTDSLSSMLEDAKKIGNPEMIELLQSEINKRWDTVQNSFDPPRKKPQASN